MGRVRYALVLGAAASIACLPSSFEYFAELAPVTTVALRFPAQPNAELALALTVEADDEGRGRVLFSDGDRAIGWFRIDDAIGGQRFASFEALTQLATHEQPTLTGLAVVDGMAIAEGLVRFVGEADAPDRVARFRVADFSRPSEPGQDMVVYPWVADPAPVLAGPLAAVQLDDGLPEALSGSAEGLIIWDALGTRASEYAEARALLLGDDPNAFADDPSQGYGLTRCPGLSPTALAGGRLLADQGRAAVALHGATLTFIGAPQPPQTSGVGAPIYACELATIELPGEASTLAVVDLESDGNDDLLVGAPALGQVWVFENHGDGLPSTPSTPSMVLEPDESDSPGQFGASIARVELGGEAPAVLVVGAPMTRVGGKAKVGRVYIFDARDGELLRSIEDLEPRTDSRHGLGVHGLDVPGREELVVSGAHELRVHGSVLADDPRP